MAGVRVTWIADVLRAAGLVVVETDGWKDYRPDYNLCSLPDAPDKPQGVLCHHTASPSNSTLDTNLYVVKNGNAVAPGPVAQVMLWRDGTYYAIAAGKANHAGAGGPWSDWLPASTSGLSVGNDRLLGIEAVNNGVGEPWSDAMLDAYEIGVAAILKYLGWDESRVLTHHEWAPSRKIDPAGPNGGRIAFLPNSLTWNGDSWRARIHERLNPPPPPIPPTPPVYDEGMDVLWRDRRFNNVFHENGDAVTIGPGSFESYKSRGVPYVEEVHDQSLIAYMRKSQLKTAQMVPSGEPGLPPFNPPADLQ